MTRQEIRSAVKQHIGNRTDKDSLINDGINLALVTIGQRHHFRSMQFEATVNIVKDDESFTVPDGTFHIKELRLVNGDSSFPMTLKLKEWITKRWPDRSNITPGKPFFCYHEGDLVYLYPPSDGEYEIKMTISKLPQKLTSDSQELEDESLALAVIAWATHYVHLSMESHENAGVWLQTFESALRTAIRADKRNSGTDKRMDLCSTEPHPRHILDPQLDPFSMGEDGGY